MSRFWPTLAAARSNRGYVTRRQQRVAQLAADYHPGAGAVGCGLGSFELGRAFGLGAEGKKYVKVSRDP